MEEYLRRLTELERELHLSWQRQEEEARNVRHLSLECQRLLIDLRRELGGEMFPEVTSQVVVAMDPSGDEATQSVFTRSWDQVAGKWVYRLVPE